MPTTTPLKRPLRPALARDQRAILRRADASADAAERVVRGAWERLLEIIERAAARGAPWPVVFREAQAALRALHTLPRALAADLADAARHARDVTAGHVPGLLRAVLEDEPLGGTSPEATGDPFADFERVPLFRPLDLETIHRLVFATGWRERLEAMTRLAAPDSLAATIATGIAAGRTPAQIARDIRPLVQGVQSSARRVARTESMRVAHAVQLESYEQLPGVIGYQIHSMHFPATRHWHAERDGTIYYRNPAPGQKGFFQMPRPPHEAPDPRERPPGTPDVACNCLCWLTPVMAPDAFTA